MGEESVFDVSKFGFFTSTKDAYEADKTNKFVFYTADAAGVITPTYWSYNTSITPPESIIKNGETSTPRLDNPYGTTIDNANGNYFGLSSSGSGGAISNEESTIGNITGDFIGNYTSGNHAYANYGGAISNKESTIGNISGDFIGNRASQGGAIYNDPFSIIGNITGNFIGNYAKTQGGAIYNEGTIGDIHGDFIGNYAKYSGGAIESSHSEIGNITGNFIGNYAEDSGGAISTNYCYIDGNITGNFIGNYAKATASGNANAQGGAIYKTGALINDIIGEFIGNYAKATASGNANAQGGAIYNESGTNGKIINSSFIGNYASSNGNGDSIAQGGAIWSNMNLLIEAAGSGKVSEFTGNFVEVNGVKESNAIYMAKHGTTWHTTLNLNAINSGKILFNDGIDGDLGYKIHITGDKTGSVIFNNEIKNAILTVEENATIPSPSIMSASAGKFTTTVTQASYLNAASSVEIKSGILNITGLDTNEITVDTNINGGELNIADLGLNNLNFNNLELNAGALNINNVGVDLVGGVMGSVSATTLSGNTGLIKVNSVDVQNDGLNEVTNIKFSEDNLITSQVATEVTHSMGPVYKYGVSYDPATGDFTFVRKENGGGSGDDYNPEVLIPSVAAVAAVSVLSDEIYSRVLSDIDTPCGVAGCSRAVGGAFVKTFGSNDTIDLKNFSGADTKFNGIIGGVESERISEGKGISAVYQAYAAYANGESKFEGEEVDQDAYYLGVGATFYKGNGFLGTTANVATVRNQAKTTSGKDKFSSYLGGAAIKLGYNYDIMGLVVQPSIYGSYTFIDSNNYTTARGARVNFDNSHSMEIAPGLKVAKEFEGILTAYAKARYVHSFNEGQEVHANGFLLPEISLKPYVEYGLGVEKQMDSVSGFAEITRRDGGREGWNGLLGLKYHW